MGITAITRVDNRSSSEVTFHNLENPATTDGVAVPPGGRVKVSIFVPWATSADAFSRQHLQIRVGGEVRYWIWQAAQWDGDHVRFCRDGVWRAPGPRLHGFSVVDADHPDRTLVIHDGCIELVDLPDDFLRVLAAGLPAPAFRPAAQQPVDKLLEAMPSVPKRRATAFSMAGPASDAFDRGQTGARFLYRDTGKRYEFTIDDAGLVTARHPNGSTTPLRRAISYDTSRRGVESTAPPFDLLAANDGRVIAKARGTNRLYFATMDHLFIHGDASDGELAVPSMYFKLDPETAQAGRRTSDLTDHLRGCFADHPGMERTPVFRLALGLDLADMMVVRVRPRVWHLIDARPPLGPYNALLPALLAAEPVLASLASQPPVCDPLADLRRGIAELRAEIRLELEKLQDPAYDAYALPSGIEGYESRRYTDGHRELRFHSIRYHRVLDLGVGHAHWHAVYDGSTGGELQPMRTGPAIGPFSWADLYRLVNGPIRDGDGYIDGTANFYALVQLKPDEDLGGDRGLGTPDAFGVLTLDEQSQFSGRWRLAHPDDHEGGGFALVTALAKDHERDVPLYAWNPATYWCPFRAGHVSRRSRLAASRQVIVVNGAHPTTGTPELYSINFSYSSMDRTWRRRPLPPGAQVAPFDDDDAAGAEAIPAALQGDVVYPETLRLREDMILHLRGSRGGVPGRWYQRYLPTDNRLVPAASELQPGPPARAFDHPWKFLSDQAFAVADRFSHLGVYDTVDSRSQYYPLDVPPTSASVLAGGDPAQPWLDAEGRLSIRAVKFWWAAPLRLPTLEPVADLEQPVKPSKRTPPSIMNPVTQLRVVQRNGRWIAMHWDKRDDDLLPFDPQETVAGLRVDPQPPVPLRQGSRSAAVTLRSNVLVEQGPSVPYAEVRLTADAAAPVAVRLRDPGELWRVRFGAIRPATASSPARAVVLHTAERGQLRGAGDGFLEARWKPADADLAWVRDACSPDGAVLHGTSVWVEDVVGHVAVPDRIVWLRPMAIALEPTSVPIGLPVPVVVRARDALTGTPVDGEVAVTGGAGGRTNTAFTTTFRMQSQQVFDPELKRWVSEPVPPRVTVRAAGYADQELIPTLYEPALRTSVDQAWLPIGRPASVTVRALDDRTGAPVAGRVLLGGVDVAAANTTFTTTCSATAPTATVTAPGYPTARVAWPALRQPRLDVSVQPQPTPLGTPITLTVRAVDADSQALVDGAVAVRGAVVGRTNVGIPITLTATRTRVYDPDLRRWIYELDPPTGTVTATGYPTVDLVLG